jgi:tRNA threonylcarbamoyladenosine biosynthesis protein TsaB
VTPLILALDTTHACGSLALARGADIVEEIAFESPTGFAHVIYGQLKALLDRNSVAISQVDCFAAASGPGSFTGVRVGLACIKGLAEALAKPVIGVSNLEALASFGTEPLRAAMLDARRGDIYGAVYDAAGQLVTPEGVSRLGAWLESLPSTEIEFVWSGAQPDLAGTRFANARVTHAPDALAAAVARIASARLARGEFPDPATLDANYVRRSDAELFWKE